MIFAAVYVLHLVALIIATHAKISGEAQKAQYDQFGTSSLEILTKTKDKDNRDIKDNHPNQAGQRHHQKRNFIANSRVKHSKNG